MRGLSVLLCVVLALFFSASVYAVKKDEAVAFKEYCGQTNTDINNSQARWNCIGRGFSSFSELYAWIGERNPHGKWGTEFWLPNEPVLANAKGKELFWDCHSTAAICGIWVKMSEGRLVFIQQLLDGTFNKKWLGIGLTTFCQGTSTTCRNFQEQAANLLPSGIDLEADSGVGAPPPPPPPPPAPPTGLTAGAPPAPNDPSKLQVDPRAGVEYLPFYPDKEDCSGVGGTAQALLTYTADGRVTDVSISASTGNRNLDRAVMMAAIQWEVIPGIRNGKTVGGQATVKMNFIPDTHPDEICNSPIQISSLKLGRKEIVEGNEHVNFDSVFAPGETIYLEVWYASMNADAAKSEFEVVWLRDGSEPPEVIRREAANGGAIGTNKALFSASMPNGLAAGKYRVGLLVDGRFRAEFHFRVIDDQGTVPVSEHPSSHL